MKLVRPRSERQLRPPGSTGPLWEEEAAWQPAPPPDCSAARELRGEPAERGEQRVLSAVHLNSEPNLESKTLTTPKLKELQGPKVRLTQPLLGATIPPNIMSFRCTVTEKSC